MKGTIVNTVAIIAGTALGLVFKRGIPVKFQETIVQCLGISVGLIGVQMALKTQNILMVIISLVLGALLGEMLNLDALLNRFGDWLTRRLGGQYGNVGEGFVTATLIYCIGAMAIVGSIQDGLTGNADTLYAKAMLDGIFSVVFASTLGIGVMMSSVPVFLYQGSITLLAGILSAALSESVITEVTAVGGVLIIGIGINTMEIKKIRLANLLPAIPVAAILATLWPK